MEDGVSFESVDEEEDVVDTKKDDNPVGGMQLSYDSGTIWTI